MALSDAFTKTNRRINVALTSSFSLLALAAVAIVLLAFRSGELEHWITHTMEVRLINTSALADLKNAQSIYRGHLLTNEPAFKQQFDVAANQLRSRLQSLQALTTDNPAQQARVNSLQKLASERLEEWQSSFSPDTVTPHTASDIRNRVLDPQIIEQAQAMTSEIDAAELTLLTTRQTVAGRNRHTLIVTAVLALSLSAIFAWFVSYAQRTSLAYAQQQATQLTTEIQDREKAELILRQTHKMEALGQLTGGVAHDFNNMLAVIIGCLDIALRALGPNEEKPRRMIGNSLDSARRAASLTQRLLAFSRMQPLSPKPLKTNRFVGDMAEMLRRTLGEHVALEVVLGAGVWAINVDPPQMESALLNLAVNARDALPAEGGKITIETSNAYLDLAYAANHTEVEAGQYVLVSLTDTGTGMPPEVIAKAFDPFFTTKAIGAGTGLGLSQVHGFIKQSRGHVSIYSEVGVGTTIKLYLPRHSSAADTDTDAELPVLSGDNHSHTILIVEDENSVREFVVQAATELGYSVLSADSARAALAMIEKHPEIDILLTDVVMPEMNGKRLVDALPRNRELSVLFMTGYTRNAIVHNGVLDAGTHLLTKPFTLAQLDSELRALLNARRHARKDKNRETTSDD